MNILITGANRGLGLGFSQHYLQQGHHVWACYRDRADVFDAEASRLHPIQWDILGATPKSEDLPSHIDILINNAGIYGPSKADQHLSDVSSQTMLQTFEVNCVGPLNVTQHLHRLNLLSDGSIIANISSKMGSSEDNSSGGTYAYRASKAALVIVSKSMAVDLADAQIHVITLHPGWVKTDMTHHTGLIDVNTSVQGMSKVISQARNYAAGSFIAFDGQTVPF
ncbi:MAG: SDR family oxidoreductase [Mariprofundaceae bacterium]|nr:SDR family oxidoreductase [Mariprofundaceae bacterium]